jgi:hypothetical protein
MIPVYGTVASRESNHDPLLAHVLSLVPNHDSSMGEEHRFLARKRGMPFFFVCKNERTVSMYIRSGLLQVVFDGVAGSGTAGGHLNLVIDRRQVGVNCAGTDHEPVSDLGI